MSNEFFSLSPEKQLSKLQQLAEHALAEWGIDNAKLSLIKHRENAVFKVDVGGDLFALRIHRHGYHSDAALRSELQWMQALQVADIHTPAVIPTAKGSLFAVVDMPGLPGAMQIDLFEWIDGEQLGSVEGGVADADAVAQTYRTIGELAARVHNQASGWVAPEGFSRHAWDAAGLAGANPFWGRFWELEAATAGERDLLMRGRDRVFEELSALPKSSDTYSLIHADFAPENLMVNGDFVRLIDFDDAGFGWHLFELATSLYFIMDEPYFDAARAALIEGYRMHRSLTDAELTKLPLFFLARGLTYVGWVHTRQETETARELTPMLLGAACALSEDYL